MPTLSVAIADTVVVPDTVDPAPGSVVVTFGDVVSAVGAKAGSNSTAAMFHRSAVGAESAMLTVVPAEATATDCDCIQNVSPLAASTHSCTSAWPGASVRSTAPSQSLPTPKVHEPAAVEVSCACGAP